MFNFSTVPVLLQEAFQALLDVLERNFAALTLPAGINSADNRTDNNLVDSKISSPFRRAIVQSRTFAYFYRPIFDENFFGVSHLVAASSREIGGVIEVIFPVSRTVKSIAWSRHRSATMKSIQRLNESNEPMEVEEISYTEPPCNFKPVIKQEKIEEVEILEVPVSAITDSRPKVILRESRFPGIWDVPPSIKTADLSNANKDFKDIKESKFSKNSEAYQNYKATVRSLVKEREESDKTETTYFYFWQMLFFILFPVAIIVVSGTIVCLDFSHESCAHRFNTTSTMIDLRNRVFGQTKAIQELGVHSALDSSRFKVLAIIGGSGIGKSYTAHIISQNFQPKKNVFYYVQPLELLHGHATVALSLCGCNLIVLENLGNRDISATADFVQQLKKTADNYCVLIIEVINVQETDHNLKHTIDLAKSKSDIERIYETKNLDVKVVVFEPLDDEVVTKCIIEAAQSRNITLSDNDIDYIRLSLQIADSGCKGAHAKVQLLEKKIEV